MPLLLLLVGCISFLIGTYVFKKNPSGKPHQAFFMFSSGISLWVSGFGLMLLTRSELYILVLNMGGILLLTGLFRFAQVFPEKSAIPVNNKLWYVPLFIGGFVAVIPKLLVESVMFVGDQAIPKQGVLFPLYSLFFVLYTLTIISFFIRSYLRADQVEKNQLQYFFLGLSLFIFIGVVCDVLLPAFGIFDLNRFGPLASIISLFTTAYAILRHNLMDIRVIIQRSAIYTCLIALITIVYASSLGALTYLFGTTNLIAAPISAGFTTVLGVFYMPFAERAFRKLTDRIFFKDSYVYSVALEELSSVLNANIDFGTLVTKSLEELKRIMKPSLIHFHSYTLSTCYNIDGNSCVLPRITSPYDSKSAVVRIQSESTFLGEFYLGPKRSGDAYTAEDKSLLRTFASLATVAIEKAELYQKLRIYTDTLEEKVEDRTRHLRALQESQRTFFDDISHALQTPLTVLKSALEILISRKSQDEILIHRTMSESVDSLSDMVRKVLQLSRVGTLPLATRTRVFNLSACINRILEYVSLITDTHAIVLNSDIRNSILVRGDEKEIEELITNLLSNAVKFTKDSAVPEISLYLTATQANAVIEIKDCGAGIAKDRLSKIFERHYRTDTESNSTQSFGLGLAIAKRIVDEHQGVITINSTVGSGTQVIVKLPIHQAVDEPELRSRA